MTRSRKCDCDPPARPSQVGDGPGSNHRPEHGWAPSVSRPVGAPLSARPGDFRPPLASPAALPPGAPRPPTVAVPRVVSASPWSLGGPVVHRVDEAAAGPCGPDLRDRLATPGSAGDEAGGASRVPAALRACGTPSPTGGDRVRVRVNRDGFLATVASPDLATDMPHAENAGADRVTGWVAAWAHLFGVTGPAGLDPPAIVKERKADALIEYRQRHPGDGSPVFGARIRCLVRNGRLVRASSTAIYIADLAAPSTVARVGPQEARSAAARHATAIVDEGTLGLLRLGGEVVPSYRFRASRGDDHVLLFIGAVDTPGLLAVQSLDRHAYAARISWDGNGALGSGTKVIEIQPGAPTFYALGCPFDCPGTSGPVAEAVRHTDEYYRRRHGRDGWTDDMLIPGRTTGAGPEWRARTDVGAPDSRGAVYLSGGVGFTDLSAFGSRAACLDIVSHEQTHAVLRAEIGDEGFPPPHPLDEAIADVFSQAIERDSRGSTDWIFGSQPPCSPLRDMASPESPRLACVAPPCIVGPSHFSNENRWVDPASGEAASYAYPNSLIVSHAAYLGSRDEATPQVHAGIEVTSIGRRFEDVMYALLTRHLDGNEDWTDFAAAWKDAARVLGAGTPEYFHALSAIDASGLWTGDFVLPVPPHTSRRIAIGQSRGPRGLKTWFCSVDRSDRLRVQAYPCTLAHAHHSCGLAYDEALGRTRWAPAVVSVGGELLLFYAESGDGDRVFYYVLTDGGAVGPFPTPAVSSGDLSAASWAGAAHLFHRTEGSEIAAGRRVGRRWESLGSLPGVRSDFGPAAVSDGHTLHVYAVDTERMLVHYETSTDLTAGAVDRPPLQTFIPSGDALDGPPTDTRFAGSPTAAIFRGRMHVAGRTMTNALRYASHCGLADGCTYRPGEWTQTQVFDTFAQGDPILYADQGLAHTVAPDPTRGITSVPYGPYLYLSWQTSLRGYVPNPVTGSPIGFGPSVSVWRYKRSE